MTGSSIADKHFETLREGNGAARAEALRALCAEFPDDSRLVPAIVNLIIKRDPELLHEAVNARDFLKKHTKVFLPLLVDLFDEVLREHFEARIPLTFELPVKGIISSEQASVLEQLGQHPAEADPSQAFLVYFLIQTMMSLSARDEGYLKNLRKLLVTGPPLMRFQAAQALLVCSVDDELPALRTLLDLLDNGEVPASRIYRDFGRFGKHFEQIMEVLLLAALDDDDHLRAEGADLLGSLVPYNRRALEMLRDLLRDPVDIVRSAAAEALGRQGPAAKIALQELDHLAQHDPDYFTRKNAAAAVAAIWKRET